MSLNFNPDDKRIEIPYSKAGIILAFVVSLMFLIGGIWFIASAAGSKNGITGFELWGGIPFIIIGGCGVVLLTVRLKNKKPAFVIDDSGIAIDPGSFSSGFINWNEILKFQVRPAGRTVLIFVFLKNPEEYIQRENSFWKKRSLKISYKVYGAPVGISPYSIGDDSAEFCAFLTKRLDEYNAAHSGSHL